MSVLIVLDAFCSFFLTGLIWTIQLVHYPSFHFIGDARRVEFAGFHQGRISLIVIPMMIIELVLCGYLAFQRPSTVSFLRLGLVVLIWGSTAFFSVKLHSLLSRGDYGDVVDRLVATNWPRTLLWSFKSVLSVWILLNP